MRNVPLREVCTINPPAPSFDEDVEVAFLGMADVSEDGQYQTQMRHYREVSKGYTAFRRGDVLLAKITPCFENGKAAHLKDLPVDFGWGSTEFHVLRPHDSVDGRYLYHLLHNSAFRLIGRRRMTGSAGQKRVPAAFLESYTVPLPPLPEQRRIADILDRADDLKRKRQQALQLAADFLRATFLDMFGDPATNPKGWPIVKVAELLDESRGGTRCGPFGSALKRHEYTDEGVPVWGIDNVLPNRFEESNSLFISESKFKQLKAYNVQSGDVLISRAGTVGRMCVAEPSSESSIFGTNLIRVSLDRTKLEPLVFTTLFTHFANRLGQLRANGKADAYSFMKTGVLRELLIPLPSLYDQTRFMNAVAKLASWENRCGAAQATIDELGVSLRSGLMSRGV